MIGRDKGAISRELRRNALPKSGYAPLSAERIAFARRHRKRKSKIERSSQLLETVRDQLIAMGRSPEQTPVGSNSNRVSRLSATSPSIVSSTAKRATWRSSTASFAFIWRIPRFLSSGYRCFCQTKA